MNESMKSCVTWPMMHGIVSKPCEPAEGGKKPMIVMATGSVFWLAMKSTALWSLSGSRSTNTEAM